MEILSTVQQFKTEALIYQIAPKHTEETGLEMLWRSAFIKK